MNPVFRCQVTIPRKIRLIIPVVFCPESAKECRSELRRDRLEGGTWDADHPGCRCPEKNEKNWVAKK